MAKRQLDLSREDEQNVVAILKRYPYLRNNITAAVSLAIFELAAKVTIETSYAPAPITPKEDNDE